MIKLQTALSAFVSRATRGRRAALLLYSGVVTLLLLCLSTVISSRASEYGDHIDTLALADVLCVLLLGAALFVIAPATVAAQVGEERRSGTLDLLRTAPLSSTMLTVGFLGGAPSAIYLLCAGPLALHVLAGLSGHYPLAVLPESLLVLGLGSVLLMLCAMLASLAITREGVGGATPMLVAGGLGLAAIIATTMASNSPSAAWAFVHPAGALAEIYARFRGPYAEAFVSEWRLERMRDSSAWAWLGVEPIFAMLVYALLAMLLLVAARRAVAGEPAARFTKWEALCLFALACVAMLVPLHATVPTSEIRDGDLGPIAFCLVGPYALCVLGATPNAIAYGAGTSKRMSERGSPLLVALIMLVVGQGLACSILGRAAWFLTSELHVVPLAFIALTLPVYSLFSSTRLVTPGGRLAFWAMLTVHFVLQVPAWFWLCEHSLQSAGMESLLAKLDAAFGVVLPAVVLWRQRVGDRELLRLR